MNILNDIHTIVADIWDDLRESDAKYDDVDSAINKYILYPEMSGDLNNSKVFDIAINRYGNKNSMTIYRGINFETAAQYKAFNAELLNNNNIISFNNISSWSNSFDEAELFAISIQTDIEFMTSEMISKIKQQKESYVMGYCGVVITTKIAPYTGIDTTLTKFARENEIILPKGQYKISNVKVIWPINKQIEEESISNVILNTPLNNKNKIDILLKQIRRFNPADIEEEAKYKIMQFLGIDINNITPKNYDIKYVQNSTVDTLASKIVITLPKLFSINEKFIDYFPNKMQEIIFFNGRRLLKNAYRDGYKQLEDKNADILEVSNFNTKYLKIFGIYDYVIRLQQSIIGERYKKLNEYDKIKSIQTQEDKDKYVNELLNIFKSIK